MINFQDENFMKRRLCIFEEFFSENYTKIASLVYEKKNHKINEKYMLSYGVMDDYKHFEFPPL